MSDKVKLPKADFEALEYSKSLGEFWKQKVLQLYLDHKLSFEVGFETLLQALVNDYEADQTPEDKVREMYELHFDDGERSPYETGYNEGVQFGVKQTLELLGLIIEGINT